MARQCVFTFKYVIPEHPQQVQVESASDTCEDAAVPPAVAEKQPAGDM